jgi:hypothetical protein
MINVTLTKEHALGAHLQPSAALSTGRPGWRSR